MKKLEIIIRPDKLEALKAILSKHSIGGITVTSVMGFGKQKDALSAGIAKGLNKISQMNLIPKVQAVVVVDDNAVNEILNIIHEKISSNKVGDGKVFISPVEDVMRIRTGERGKKAL
jgi:nitrogen regulatory protein P-II 1